MSAEWLFVVAILATGFILLAIEIFLIPGIGIAGPLGAVALVAGVSLAWAKFGTLWGMASLVASVAITAVGLWFFPRSKAGKRLVLNTGLAGVSAADRELGKLIGEHGVTLTPLRPSGVAEFNDQRIDVVTDGSYLEPNQRVRVVRVEGNRIVVEPAESNIAT